MFSPRRSLGTGAGLLAAMLFLASPALAGDRVHAPPPPPPHSKVTKTPVVVPSRSVAVSIQVSRPAVASKDLTVRLRGPDGQIRRFPVEGGWASIDVARAVVLRPGQSITIRWVAAK
jgi:hypothetical protein